MPITRKLIKRHRDIKPKYSKFGKDLVSDLEKECNGCCKKLNQSEFCNRNGFRSAYCKKCIKFGNMPDLKQAIEQGFSKFIQVWIEAGANQGLTHKESKQLVISTVKGSIKLLNQSKKTPRELINMVSSNLESHA